MSDKLKEACGVLVYTDIRKTIPLVVVYTTAFMHCNIEVRKVPDCLLQARY